MKSVFAVYPRLVCLAAVILASVFPFAGQAMAQRITTDATIVGQVTDEAKAVTPGVTVTATSPALQVPSVTVVTDARGEYRVTSLPIGTYAIDYTLSGFRTVRREGVRLTAGFTAKIDITLTVGGLEEKITVSGDAPQVDVTATNTVTQLTREALETIPAGGAGYIGLLQMVPGARSSVVDVGGSSINTNPGLVELGSVSQSWQSVDGVATKNPRSTESGNYFDFSGAEEAVVSTVGHDASVPNRGVNLNVVLPSGGNQFRAKLFYGGTSSRFESEQDVQGGGGGSVVVRDDLRGELGGRLIKDKLWFWVSARKQRTHEEVTDCVKPDGSFCEENQDTFFVTTKLTWQPSKSNRIVGFFMRNRGFAEETTTALRPWESRRPQVLEPDVGKLEWQYMKGNTLVLGVNFGGWRGHSGTICPGGPHNLKTTGVDFSGCADAGVATVDSVTGVISGYNERGGERLLESRYQVRTNVIYYKPDLFLGNHEIKAGFDLFHAPQNRHQVGRGGAGNYRLTFRSGVADQVALSNNPVHPDLAIRYYGTYLADSWTIGRRLTLNLGIRHAYDLGYENAACRDAADDVSTAVYPAACFSKVEMPAYNTLSPRLRAAYDLTGDGKTVIKGGWGRYQQMRSADQIQLVAKNVVNTTTFRWRDLNGNRNYDRGEVNLDLNGPDFISQTGVPGYAGLQGGVVNPDETTPHTDEYMLQFERQLTQTLAVRVTGVERRIGNAQRIANDLRPYSAYNIPYTNPDPGPDGVVGTADDTGSFITYYDYPAELAGVRFAQGKIVNDPKANEQYHTLELSMTKRLAHNWQFFASYTATKKNYPLPANNGTFNSVDPNSEIFAANNTWEWLGRASGSYLFPHKILVSANFEHRSGNVLARTASFRNAGTRVGALTLRVEPFGSIRLPNLNLLTLRGEKRFGLPKKQQVSLRANVYNALNTDAATAMTVQSGRNFGRVTGRVLPRIADFQVAYEF